MMTNPTVAKDTNRLAFSLVEDIWILVGLADDEGLPQTKSLNNSPFIYPSCRETFGILAREKIQSPLILDIAVSKNPGSSEYG